MTYLPRIALLLIAVNLGAQEIDDEASQNAAGTDPALDSIAAEVFADDLPPAPVDEQTVPVADDADEPAPEDVPESGLPGPMLPDGATDEEQLMYQYSRYLDLLDDHVYDEADTVAKRVVELTLKVRGPKSTEYSKALINLAIVQHYTGQYDAAQQNFQSAIEIIENNEDRLNAQLVNPLKGLGASQLDAGRPDLANETFSRAVHVTHVNEGPHNLDQVEILESLAETHLRLGSIDGAREMQEIIYSLNAHAYSEDSMEFVSTLLRSADWQHRTGFINDERTTLRRAIRIIEQQVSQDDLQLVEPLIRLGRTYFYFDASDTHLSMQNSLSSGEVYFKRAVRIATENPDTDWQVIARSSLSLGDYYMFEGNSQRASTVYRETWNFLSEDEERLATRREQLERAVILRERPLPKFITPPDKEAAAVQPAALLNGSITLAFEISTGGRITNLKVLDAQPVSFAKMQRTVHREMRSRLYRPRFDEAEPVTTSEQLFVHRFYYTQADLDAEQPATEGDGEDEDEDEDEEQT
jgi:tetratricopeptide (TPR) repeat protein